MCTLGGGTFDSSFLTNWDRQWMYVDLNTTKVTEYILQYLL